MQEIKALDRGKCKFCGASIYWTRTARNDKPMPLQVKITTIVDKFGEVINGHEPHHAYCPKYPKGGKKS